jgi:hypothetical protein
VIVSNRNRHLKIAVENDVLNHSLFSKQKKDQVIFSTPKPVSNMASKPLIPPDDRAMNPIFKQKPSMPTTASLAAFAEISEV